MRQEQAPVHPDSDEFADYFASKLTAETEESVERHLATCSACTQLARQVYSSTLVLQQWSTTTVTSMDYCAVLHRNLTTLLEKAGPSAWQNRIRLWTENWDAKAEGAVRMVLETPGKAANILTSGLGDLLRPQARWQFALDPIPARIRGQSEGPILIASTITAPRARVAISSEAREVEIRIDDWPLDQPPPLVLLAPVSVTPEAPEVREFHRIPGVSYCMARFENVEPGEYLIALEPTR
jgi:hypothetical protein